MKRKANQKEYFEAFETPKQIQDEIAKDLMREMRRRQVELEDDVFRLQDAMRGLN